MEIWEESLVQKDKFRSAANKLLNHCFIIKRREDMRNDYVFVVQNKRLFDEYFDLLGYELRVNESSGVIGLLSLTGTGRLRLKKIESVLLLILRLLYIEKKKEIGLSDDVVIMAEEIHDKYGMLKIQSKPAIDKTTLRDVIRLFKRFNLADTIDSDVTRPEARIVVYPSVLFAMTSDNINELYDIVNEKLIGYTGGNEADDEEDPD
ncbi:MAG: DUF4194 domain-containing protein [Eubacteriales bacterium]|nr:DUF4194 domain-containing protein [Eubacteriales bacterium]MDD4327947.1 DUF4194 domain-containing protein [Eubacteriales bacterium]MDD4717967.1 DUF4194 domain-containing protein [Eubacteriales bacterium]